MAPQSKRQRLDLDSVFGQIDADLEVFAASVDTQGGLGLGRTSAVAEEFLDLPRAPNGEAQIADARNDHNLPLAQLHVAVTRFYRNMLAAFHGKDRDAAKRDTIRHFQHGRPA